MWISRDYFDKIKAAEAEARLEANAAADKYNAKATECVELREAAKKDSAEIKALQKKCETLESVIADYQRHCEWDAPLTMEEKIALRVDVKIHELERELDAERQQRIGMMNAAVSAYQGQCLSNWRVGWW